MTMETIAQGDLFRGQFHTVERPKESRALQIPLVKMLKSILRPDVLVRHIPSGGYDARSGAKLKMMGRLAGCADLEFMWRDAKGLLRVLFLELKLPGRKLLPSQESFAKQVQPLGPYCVATSINEALAALKAYNLLLDAP
jgi:hypothetical protein